MLLNKKYSYEELEDYYEKYIDRYNDSFSISLKLYLFLNKEKGLYMDSTSDAIEQFYCEFNLVDKSKSYHYMFNELINEIYKDKKERKIIEVGGGIVPTLGRIMASESNSEIIVYDNRLVTNNNDYDNLILKEETFYSWTNIKDSDLIVGLLPCEGAESIIKNACKNRKEFILQLCDCVPYSNCSLEVYRNHILSLAREECLENGLEFYQNNKINYFSSPLIYSKKNR